MSSERATTGQPLPELMVRDAAEWKAWLRDNHLTSRGVRLVLAKKGTAEPTSLTYQAALEEALCHGWIDSTAGPGTQATFLVRFTPRRARSIWSRRNTQIVERLIAEGRMQPAGLDQVERAEADGRWARAYSQAAAEMPADLEAALAASPEARAMFARLSAQNRFSILHRLADAKRAETRGRRLEALVAMLARGETIHPQRAAKIAGVVLDVHGDTQIA